MPTVTTRSTTSVEGICHSIPDNPTNEEITDLNECFVHAPIEINDCDRATPEIGEPLDCSTPIAGPTNSSTPDAGPTSSSTSDAGRTSKSTPDSGPTTPDEIVTDNVSDLLQSLIILRKEVGVPKSYQLSQFDILLPFNAGRRKRKNPLEDNMSAFYRPSKQKRVHNKQKKLD